MSSSANPTSRSINCPNCGAGNSVLGGGRVKTYTCLYCNTVLDALDDYKIIFKYQNMLRPDSPFSIGMKGKIKDVLFEIIGTLEVSDSEDSWVEHQLFSPSHGYAWLTWEDGHCLFTRKIRSVPHLAPDNLYDYDTASITFVEGAFNFIPCRAEGRKQPGEYDYQTYFYGSHQFIEQTVTANEREYELTEYLDKDSTFASFGIPVPRKTLIERLGLSTNIHILQKITLHTWQKHLAIVSALVIVAAIVLFASQSNRNTLMLFEKELLIGKANPTASSANTLNSFSKDFTVDNAKRPLVFNIEDLKAKQGVQVQYQLQISDSQGEVYRKDLILSPIKRSSVGGKAQAIFNLPSNGTYTATLDFKNNDDNVLNLRLNYFNKATIWIKLLFGIGVLSLLFATAPLVITKLKRHSAIYGGDDD